jgi:ribosomal protein S18 acetylase RimI-like enzyme
MAALLHPAPAGNLDIIDLHRIAGPDLAPVLEEEIGVWRERLDWDFSQSASLVRRFVDLRALNGAALVEDGGVAGYSYYVLEEQKGLIGDLYVRRAHRAAGRESALLESVLDAILANPAITRIESQIMMQRSDTFRHIPHSEYASAFERNFMRVEMDRADLAPGRVRRVVYLERWSDLYQDGVAHLIAAAYAGHIDGRINDQYRTPLGARRFLHNVIQYPGCGSFYPPASYAAFEASNGKICGVSLASLVAPRCGHITQICVSPAVRGTGIGHALLRQSLAALRDAGCRSVSLTVTAGNEDAVGLYERVGFRTAERFVALVWEGF